MKLLIHRLSAATFALLVTSCAAGVGAGPFGHVPFDAPATCSGYCTKMGLGLSAVVVMANNVGCVCSPTGQSTSAALRSEAGAAAGGMTAILMQQQQAQAAAQQQHH